MLPIRADLWALAATAMVTLPLARPLWVPGTVTDAERALGTRSRQRRKPESLIAQPIREETSAKYARSSSQILRAPPHEPVSYGKALPTPFETRLDV